MARLTTVQIPLDWESYGFPSPLQTSTTCLVEGDPAWGWDVELPDLGIAAASPASGTRMEGWDLDHVVVLAPDLDELVKALAAGLGAPRLRARIEGRPTAFWRVGPLLEVIESPVRTPALFGVALATEHSLEETARKWRERGLTVTDPQPAIQPGRTIFTVKGTKAGFAVMSADGAPG